MVRQRGAPHHADAPSHAVGPNPGERPLGRRQATACRGRTFACRGTRNASGFLVGSVICCHGIMGSQQMALISGSLAVGAAKSKAPLANCETLCAYCSPVNLGHGRTHDMPQAWAPSVLVDPAPLFHSGSGQFAFRCLFSSLAGSLSTRPTSGILTLSAVDHTPLQRSDCVRAGWN